MSSKGMVLKLNEANENNLYVKTFNERKEDFDDLRRHCVCNSIAGDSEPIYLLGEFYGKGVQDLGFGKPKGAFSVFDIYIGKPRVGSYPHSADEAELSTLSQFAGFDKLANRKPEAWVNQRHAGVQFRACLRFLPSWTLI